MPHRRTSTRRRLIQAATQLFITQGIAETTTRQIADAAAVNEVTLFRQFGSKHGLVLAMMEDPQVLTQLGMALGQPTSHITDISQALKSYANVHLQALAQLQEFVRSLIGEAGHYSPENRRALGQGVAQANRYTAQYLTNVLLQKGFQLRLPPEKLAGLLNSLLLGYAVLEFSSEFHDLWQDRENFVDALVQLFLHGALVTLEPQTAEALLPTHEALLPTLEVSYAPDSWYYMDLPSSLVHQILARAMKQGAQDYAIAYVLLGAGLSAAEIACLERTHAYSDEQHYWLQIAQGRVRQVPVNQWIAGQRYGYHPENPLTQWLQSRTDNVPALFMNERGQPMRTHEVVSRWQLWVAGLLTPMGTLPAIEQCWASWCVDMLMRGLSLDDLRALTGETLPNLAPFMERVQQRRAMSAAAHLDQQYPAS